MLKSNFVGQAYHKNYSLHKYLSTTNISCVRFLQVAVIHQKILSQIFLTLEILHQNFLNYGTVHKHTISNAQVPAFTTIKF